MISVIIDFLKGDDSKGCGRNLIDKETKEIPYKTLSSAIKAYANKELEITLIGYNELDLTEIKNCKINGDSDSLLIIYENKNNIINIDNCTLNCPISIKPLTDRIKPQIIRTNNKVIISGPKLLVTSPKKSNLDITVFENYGNLDIQVAGDIKVSSKITFVHNHNILKSIIPDCISNGGNLFYSESGNEVTTELFGKNSEHKDPKNNLTTFTILSSYQRMTSYNKNPISFSLLIAHNNAIIKGLNCIIDYQGAYNNQLIFKVQKLDKSKNNVNKLMQLHGFKSNSNIGIMIYESSFKILSDNSITFKQDDIKQDDIKLVNCNIDKTLDCGPCSDIKILKHDYIVDDFDTSKFLIDASNNNIDILIPNDVKFDSLLFKRIDFTPHKVILNIINLNTPCKTIELWPNRSCTKMFRYKNKVYIKYIN